MTFLSPSVHHKDGMAGAHAINQHRMCHYCYKIKSKVFSSTNTSMANQTRSTHELSSERGTMVTVYPQLHPLNGWSRVTHQNIFPTRK